jgi:hypothetical protein
LSLRKKAVGASFFFSVLLSRGPLFPPAFRSTAPPFWFAIIRLVRLTDRPTPSRRARAAPLPALSSLPIGLPNRQGSKKIYKAVLSRAFSSPLAFFYDPLHCHELDTFPRRATKLLLARLVHVRALLDHPPYL